MTTTVLGLAPSGWWRGTVVIATACGHYHVRPRSLAPAVGAPFECPMDHPIEQAANQEAADLARARASILWPRAVAFLRRHLSAETQAQIRAALPTPDWPAGYHTFWGMGIRNVLRDHGFSERNFGIRNLDHIYIPLVEDAVGAPGEPPQQDVPGLAARVRRWLRA